MLRLFLLLCLLTPSLALARGGRCNKGLLCDLSAIVVLGFIIVGVIAAVHEKRQKKKKDRERS
jgi:hypothetical protein